MGFSRQESWSGFPFASPEDLPDPGIEPRSSALHADSLPPEAPGKPCAVYKTLIPQQGLNPQVSLVAQMVKNPPAMQETQVQFLGWEDPLEKGMATHSSILAWEIPGQRSLVGYSPWSQKESDMTERLTQRLNTGHGSESAKS